MKLSRRSSEESRTGTDTKVDLSKGADLDGLDDLGVVDGRKGRPTPKRRDAQGRKGPVTAPKTRKEAYARQKQLAKEQKRSPSAATTKPRSVAEQRAALKRGDPSALPRRDQGSTRKLARDYVDSHRMLSNYTLLLFPLFFITTLFLKAAEFIVILLLLVLIGEWFYVGRKLRAMAIERFGKADGSPMSLGFYMGSRAYLPRRMRLPGPQSELGDEI